jgi:hypothetical protein
LTRTINFSRMASENDVQHFLNTLAAKMSIGEPPIQFLNGRENNTQTLAYLEISVQNQLDAVKALTIADYSSGPLDDNRGGSLKWWVFGKMIKGKEIYIKISLNELNETPICMSFHTSKNKLTYPLK